MMPRISLNGSTLTLALVFLVGISLAQKTDNTTTRPGDEAYMPTKLEWAALELQANNGVTTWTSESPVMISFVAWSDGKTVLCVIQYTPEVPAQVVKINRDASQRVFDIYAKSRGWEWLRLEFKESVLRR
jgi:hypothetical protein